MKVAKDLMTESPLKIQTGALLRDVVEVFVKEGVTSAPVVDSYGVLVGMLSELDLARAYLKHHLQIEKNEKVAHHQELLQESVDVAEDDTLSDVIKALLKAPTHRVLVKNSGGKLTGIISPKDILAFLIGENNKIGDLRKELEEANDEIRRLRGDLEDVMETLSQYKEIYHESPTMLHSVDESGKIIMANARLHQSLGYDENELLGKSMLDLYSHSVHHEAIQGLKRIMEEGFHHSTYTTMVRKNGEKVRVDVASRALYSDTGKFLCTITATRLVDSEKLLRALHGVLNETDVD